MHSGVPYFVDPTIPGLSVRDVTAHAIETVDPESLGGDRHRGFLLRKALARLDGELLRDLGLGREAT